jgi:hypothetical protein
MWNIRERKNPRKQRKTNTRKKGTQRQIDEQKKTNFVGTGTYVHMYVVRLPFRAFYGLKRVKRFAENK